MTETAKNAIPDFARPFLWSYDIEKLDLEKHKKRIITNILNLGTREATNWVRNYYSADAIKEALKNPLPGEWNDKSLNYWALIYEVTPGSTERKIP